MNALIERCRLAGIRLWVEGTDLQCDAPKGAMTPELITDLKAHKPAIVKALGQPPAPKGHRGLGGYTTPLGVPPLRDCELARQIRSMPEDVPGAVARDGKRYAVYVEDPTTDPVVMALATPAGTCELLIPRDRYDPFLVLATVRGWEA